MKVHYLRNRNRLADIENRLVVAKGEGGGKDWEFGISRCKLLYIEWINNKVLLYSTGNHIQYRVINHNGREKKRNSAKWQWDSEFASEGFRGGGGLSGSILKEAMPRGWP